MFESYCDAGCSVSSCLAIATLRVAHGSLLTIVLGWKRQDISYYSMWSQGCPIEIIRNSEASARSYQATMSIDTEVIPSVLQSST